MSGKSDKQPSHKKKNDKPVEGRRYAIASPSFISAIAESCGISGLGEDIPLMLGEDVSYRLREILFNCTVHLRSKKEKKLRSSHVDKALPGGSIGLYGYLSGGSANFLHVPEADAFIYEDTLIDVDLPTLALSNDKYVQAGEVFIKGMWFLHDDFDDSTSELPIAINDVSNNCPPLPPLQIAYYTKIASAIFSKHEKLFNVAIKDLSTNSKIALVVPYFLNLLREGLKGVLRGGLHCTRLLAMVHSLTRNPYIYRDATVMVNELITTLLMCALDPAVPSGKGFVDDYELRTCAAEVLASVVKFWYRSNVKLLKDIVQKLGSVLFDGSSSLRSHYGALMMLCALGVEALDYCLWPHLEQYLGFISTLRIEHETKELEGPILIAAELLYRREMKFLNKRGTGCNSSVPQGIVTLDRLLYSHFGDALCARRPCPVVFTSLACEGLGHSRNGDDALVSSVIKDNICNDFEMEYRNWTAIAKIPNRLVPLFDDGDRKSTNSQQERRHVRNPIDIASVFEVPVKRKLKTLRFSSIRGVSPWPHVLQRRVVDRTRGQFVAPSMYLIKSCQVNCIGKLVRKCQLQQQKIAFTCDLNAAF